MIATFFNSHLFSFTFPSARNRYGCFNLGAKEREGDFEAATSPAGHGKCGPQGVVRGVAAQPGAESVVQVVLNQPQV